MHRRWFAIVVAFAIRLISCVINVDTKITAELGTEKFRTNTIRYVVDDLRAIIGRIDMYGERPLAKRQAISPKQPLDTPR